MSLTPVTSPLLGLVAFTYLQNQRRIMKKVTKDNGRVVITNGVISISEETAAIRGRGKPTDTSKMPVTIPKHIENQDRKDGRVK